MRRAFQNQISPNRKKIRRDERVAQKRLLSELSVNMTTLPVEEVITDNIRTCVEKYVGELLNDDATTLPSAWPRALIFSEEPFNYSIGMRVKTEYTYGRVLPIQTNTPTLSQGRFNQLVDNLFEPFTSCGYNTLGKLVSVCRYLNISYHSTQRVINEIKKDVFELYNHYPTIPNPGEREHYEKQLIEVLDKYVADENGPFKILVLLLELGVYNLLSSIYVSKEYLERYVNPENTYVDAMTENAVVNLLHFTGILSLDYVKTVVTANTLGDILYDSPRLELPQDLMPSYRDFCISPELVKGSETVRLLKEEKIKKEEELKKKKNLERKKEKLLEQCKELGINPMSIFGDSVDENSDIDDNNDNNGNEDNEDNNIEEDDNNAND